MITTTRNAMSVRSKRTGIVMTLIPVAFCHDSKQDMFRLYAPDGTFTSVVRDSVRRNYVAMPSLPHLDLNII